LTASTSYTMDLAVVLSGTSILLYKDGVQVSSGTLSGTLQNNVTAQNLFTTMANNNNGESPANTTTRIKAIRITKAARYTGSSYGVPSLPLPKA